MGGRRRELRVVMDLHLQVGLMVWMFAHARLSEILLHMDNLLKLHG